MICCRQFILWRNRAEGLQALLRQCRRSWVRLLAGVAKPECTLYSHTDYVTCLAAAKDVPVVASAGLRGQVLLWDLPSTVRSAKQVRLAPLATLVCGSFGQAGKILGKYNVQEAATVNEKGISK